MAYQGGKWTVPEGILPGARINVVAKERASSVLSPRGILAIPLELNWGAEDDIISFKAKDYTRDALYNFGYEIGSPELREIDEVFRGATEILVARLNTGGEKAKCSLGESKWSGIRGNDFAITVEADPDSDYIDNVLADVKVNFKTEGDTVTATYTNIPEGYDIVGSLYFNGEQITTPKVTQKVIENKLSTTFTTGAQVGDYQIKAGLKKGTVKYTISTATVNVELDPATESYMVVTKGTDNKGAGATGELQNVTVEFTANNNSITATYSNLPEGKSPMGQLMMGSMVASTMPGRIDVSDTDNSITYTFGKEAPYKAEYTFRAKVKGDGNPIVAECKFNLTLEGEDKPETIVASYKNATPEVFDTQVPGKYIVKTFLDGAEINKQKVRGMYQIKDTDFIIWNKERELELTAGMPLEGGTNGEIKASNWVEILNKLEPQNFHILGWPTTDETLQQMAINFTRKMRDEMGVKFQTVMPKTVEPANYEGVIQIENSVKNKDVKDQDSALVYWVAGQEAGCKVQNSVANMAYDGNYDIDVDYSQRDLENLIENGYFAFHLARGIDRKQYVKTLLDINTLTDLADDQAESWKNNQTIRVMDQCCNDIAAIFNNNYFGKVPNTTIGRTELQNDIITHHQELETIQAIENFDPSDVVVEAGEDKVTVIAQDAIEPVNAMEKLFMTIIVI